MPTLLRDAEMLGACLASIERNVSRRISCEVIVIVNGAPAEAVTALRAEAPGVRIVVSGVNRGFAGGCNLGVREARGELLVFLNDDAEVLPGWLETLVETADRHPEAGAVGGRIDLPDGTVQEIGSIVWQDGSTLGVGRGLDAETLRYRHLREVDYCSASSLLVRREVWDEVGGYDERYFPAYYEDADLCLAIRATGRTILCQPRSRIVHRESGTAGSGFRDFLILRNRREFCRKWAGALAERAPARPGSPLAVDHAVERARNSYRRLLIVDDRPPQRDVGSGFSVLLDAAHEWGKRRFAISVVATDVTDGDHDLLADLGIELLHEPVERVLASPDRLFDVVVISRPNNFERCAASVREHQPQATLLYLAEALFHRRLERQAGLATDDLAREAIAEQARAMREVEERIPRAADRIVTVSVEEAEQLAAIDGTCPIDTIPPLRSDARLTPTGFTERRDLLFVPGWLAGESSPNVDALAWFVEAVLPRVRQAIPGVTLRVTGGSPPPSVRRLAGDGVRLLGRVADLADAYAAARVVVVPVRYGAGVKVKYVEAIQYGVPVVATSVGAEGVAGPDSAIVTDDPESFAKGIVELYTNPAAWSAQRGRIERLVERWEAGRTSWTAVVENARIEHRAGRRTQATAG